MGTVMEQYIEEAMRTRSEAIHLLNLPDEAIYIILTNIYAAGNGADIGKRGLFYGTDPETLVDRVDVQTQALSDMASELDKQAQTLHAGLTDKDLLHGVLGLASETGELAEQIVNSALKRQDPDLVNISEEVGDILWYCAILLRACGKTFEDVARQNIAKLKARYPEKFTLEKAENRDLENERKILEETN